MHHIVPGDAMNGPDSASLREAFERIIPLSPFTRWMATRLTVVEPGLVVIEAALRPEMRQHHGYAHGAIVSYMADTACAWVAATVTGDVVTAEFKINFLAPGLGHTLRARAEVVRAGSRQVVTRADVWALDADKETMVATCLATIAVVSNGAPGAAGTRRHPPGGSQPAWGGPASG
jgi:uncharacterized protein (TIGR00369 family)